MSFPHIGQTVYIDKQGMFARGHARLLDLAGDMLILDEPLRLGKSDLLPVDTGDTVQLSYRAPDGSLCYFDSIVAGKGMTDHLASIRVRKPALDQVVRIQRRAFVRMEVPIQISLLCVRDDPSGSLITGQGTTHDISGGGLSFWTPKDLGIVLRDRITVKFQLPNEDSSLGPLSAKGLIVRDAPWSVGAGQLFSLRFEEIGRSSQQRIIQYVFRKQIELRSKGL